MFNSVYSSFGFTDESMVFYYPFEAQVPNVVKDESILGATSSSFSDGPNALFYSQPDKSIWVNDILVNSLPSSFNPSFSCLLFSLNREGQEGGILYSTQANDVTPSGYSIGFNDNNELFVHAESEDDFFFEVFDEINLSSKNIIAATKSDNLFSILQYDFLSDSFSEQSVLINTEANVNSNYSSIGGNNYFSLNFEAPNRLIGEMDYVSLINEIPNQSTLKELLRSLVPANSTTVSSFEIINQEFSSNKNGEDEEIAFRDFLTAFSDDQFNNSQKLVKANISGFVSGNNISWSGEIDSIPSSGNYTTNYTGSFSFSGKNTFVDDGFLNTLANLSWKDGSNESLTAELKQLREQVNSEVVDYDLTFIEKTKMNGVFGIDRFNSGNVFNLSFYEDTNPSLYNKFGSFSDLYNRFLVDPKFSQDLSVFLNGEAKTSGDFTIAEQSSLDFGFNNNVEENVIYDILSNLNTSSGFQSIFSSGDFISGNFWKNSSNFQVDMARVRLGQDYQEISKNSLLFNKKLVKNINTSFII